MPSTSEVINAHIRAAQSDIHTSIPARVLSYNPESQTVDVQADINHLLSSNEVLERGAIRGVPVQFGGTTRTLISFPIKSGDTGILVFQERSTDEWTHQKQDLTGEAKGVIAKDRRMHDYSDCVFVPGVHPYAKSPVGGRGHTYKHDPMQDTVIKHNIGTPAECYMFMKPDGSILFQNKNVQMQLLVDGTLKIDCKDVIVNAETSIAMTTETFSIDCTDITITSDTTTVDSATAIDMTTAALGIGATTTEFTGGTIKHDSVSIDKNHTHGGVVIGTDPTGVPNN